jgi:hypothetical protein
VCQASQQRRCFRYQAEADTACVCCCRVLCRAGQVCVEAAALCLVATSGRTLQSLSRCAKITYTTWNTIMLSTHSLTECVCWLGLCCGSLAGLLPGYAAGLLEGLSVSLSLPACLYQTSFSLGQHVPACPPPHPRSPPLTPPPRVRATSARMLPARASPTPLQCCCQPP